MHNSGTLNELRTLLRESVTTGPVKASLFFKTGVGQYAHGDEFIGVAVPKLRTIAKNYASLSYDDLQFLLESPVNEERLFALIVLTDRYKRGNRECKEAIYYFYTKHMHRVNNWNLVDASAHLIVGAHLYGKDLSFLKLLVVSENVWYRRIAIVATWYFIRKNEVEPTFMIAELLLQDRHDLIHKAVGWMLREAGKKDRDKLALFLEEHKLVMPRTMLRYALEKFSKEEQVLFLKRAS